MISSQAPSFYGKQEHGKQQIIPQNARKIRNEISSKIIRKTGWRARLKGKKGRGLHSRR